MTIVMLPVAGIVVDPANLRKVKDGEELQNLRRDLTRRGILVPLLVRRNGDVYMLIDGHRRLAAAKLAGLEQVPCRVLDKDVTESQIREIQLVSQLLSEGLTAFEVYTGCKNWLALHPQATAKELATAISRSEGFTSMTLSLGKCVKAVQDAAAQGLIGVKEWNMMSQVSPEEQMLMLQAKRTGATAEGLKRLARKPGNGVRSVKVKCLLSSGVSVTVAGNGQGLTLDEIIENLIELIKEAKRANDQSLDPSTFAAVFKDKAGRK
jgi:ParB family chromosome partitioning protein